MFVSEIYLVLDGNKISNYFKQCEESDASTVLYNWNSNTNPGETESLAGTPLQSAFDVALAKSMSNGARSLGEYLSKSFVFCLFQNFLLSN